MPSKIRQDDQPRFLYSPWRNGQVLKILRHQIVQQGPKRITAQLASYDEFSEEFRRTRPVFHVDVRELESQGWVWKWYDAALGLDHRCPLGRVYRTEEAARFALESWARTALNAVDVNPSEVN